MTTLLLEDEPLAAERTRKYLKRYGHGFTEAGWCQSIEEAVHWLHTHPEPQLILSDIELLDGNVFELFEQRSTRAPVVFATAYDQYLLKAFETNGVGYLLKPYTFEQFAAALDKVRELVQPTPSAALSPTTLAALRDALTAQQHQYRSRFTVRRTSGITLLPAADVSLLLAEDKVTFALDAQGKRHALNHTLSNLEEQLDPTQWFRVSRAELIHLPYVERLEPYGRDRLAVHLRGQVHVPVSSRDRTPGLRRWVEG